MSEEEKQWIQAARKGDQEAFGHLIHLYEQNVFALTRRMCRNPDDAADAAQEAFLAAWRGLPNFRGDARFSTWLYRLASNACIDQLRREGRHQNAIAVSLDDTENPVDLPDDTASPLEHAEQSELRDAIEKGLQALSPEHRAVLVLREIHQLHYEEIAQALSLDLGTVKSRINRGRKQLRNFLTQPGNLFGSSPSNKAEKEGCP